MAYDQTDRPAETADLAARLDAELRRAEPAAILEAAVRQFGDRLAMVSSFGAESATLLHLVSQVDKALPVLFLETGMLFPATLAYQQSLSEQLGLTGVRLVRPDGAEVKAEDPEGTLHGPDADACCDLRKTRPLERALAPFQAWVTGRKRFQTADRANLELFEVDAHARCLRTPPPTARAVHGFLQGSLFVPKK